MVEKWQMYSKTTIIFAISLSFIRLLFIETLTVFGNQGPVWLQQRNVLNNIHVVDGLTYLHLSFCFLLKLMAKLLLQTAIIGISSDIL